MPILSSFVSELKNAIYFSTYDNNIGLKLRFEKVIPSLCFLYNGTDKNKDITWKCCTRVVCIEHSNTAIHNLFGLILHLTLI